MKASKLAILRMTAAICATTSNDNILVIGAAHELPEIEATIAIEYQPKRNKKGKRQKDWQR